MYKLAIAIAMVLPAMILAEETAFGITVGGTNDGNAYGLYFAETKEDGVGWYFDISSNLNGPRGEDYGGRFSYFDPDLGSVPDPKTGGGTETMSAHIGATSTIMDRLYGYIGVGIYIADDYEEFYDPYEILGDNGHYHSFSDSQTKISASGGVLYNVNDTFQLKFGYDTGNENANIGIGIQY